MTTNILVVNIRGIINAPPTVRRTLQQLRVITRHRATIIPDNTLYRGMLQVVKDYVSWCPINETFIAKILEKRARKDGGAILTNNDLQVLGYSNFLQLAQALQRGEITLNKLKGLRSSFTFAPPKGGFKRSIRRPFSQGGLLAENPNLPKLVEAML